MITVHFFASLREALGTGQTEVKAEGLVTVADLMQQLASGNGDNWQQILLQEKVLMAVNQQVADRNTRVADGDEVAFFPPVTGG